MHYPSRYCDIAFPSLQCAKLCDFVYIYILVGCQCSRICQYYLCKFLCLILAFHRLSHGQCGTHSFGPLSLKLRGCPLHALDRPIGGGMARVAQTEIIRLLHVPCSHNSSPHLDLITVTWCTRYEVDPYILRTKLIPIGR